MTLPIKYDAFIVQQELDKLQQELDNRKTVALLLPQGSAPVDPVEGSVAISDGAGSGFDGSSGAGLYRYQSSVWVFVG